jgi:hypothetical protein
VISLYPAVIVIDQETISDQEFTGLSDPEIVLGRADEAPGPRAGPRLSGCARATTATSTPWGRGWHSLQALG